MAHYEKVIAGLRQFKREMPTLVGNEMVNYALDNMRSESFRGVPWAPRKANAPRNTGRRLLIDTGDGERSIRVVNKTATRVDVSANDYMEAHNTGATINKTVNVRSHRRNRSGRSEEVKAHSRKMNTKLPKRTFLEPGPELDERIVNTLELRFKALTS